MLSRATCVSRFQVELYGIGRLVSVIRAYQSSKKSVESQQFASCLTKTSCVGFCQMVRPFSFMTASCKAVRQSPKIAGSLIPWNMSLSLAVISEDGLSESGTFDAVLGPLLDRSTATGLASGIEASPVYIPPECIPLVERCSLTNRSTYQALMSASLSVLML